MSILDEAYIDRTEDYLTKVDVIAGKIYLQFITDKRLDPSYMLFVDAEIGEGDGFVACHTTCSTSIHPSIKYTNCYPLDVKQIIRDKIGQYINSVKQQYPTLKTETIQLSYIP